MIILAHVFILIKMCFDYTFIKIKMCFDYTFIKILGFLYKKYYLCNVKIMVYAKRCLTEIDSVEK